MPACATTYQLNEYLAHEDRLDAIEHECITIKEIILEDFESQGFYGSRFNEADRTTLQDVVYDRLCEEETAALLANMFMNKSNPQKFRDSAYAVLNHITGLINSKACEMAIKQFNDNLKEC